MAISEAVEDAATRDDTKYSLGSVLNHVLLHQTVVGLEAHRADGDGRRGARRDHRAAPAAARTSPASRSRSSAGSSAARRLPGHRRRARGRAVADPRRLRLRLRRHRQDDPARQDAHPRLRLHPRADPRRRPALPRHGARSCRLLKEHGVIEAQSVHQRAAFEAGVQFARAEGILPAPEPHPRDPGRDRRGARRPRRQGETRVILFNLCGPRPLRPGGLRAATWRARSRTTSTRPRRSRPRSPTCPRSADRHIEGRVRRPAALGLRIVTCPSSPATPVAARSTPSRRSRPCSPRSAAVPAAGRYIDAERRATRAAHARTAPEPAQRSRPARRRAEDRGAARPPAAPGVELGPWRPRRGSPCWASGSSGGRSRAPCTPSRRPASRWRLGRPRGSGPRLAAEAGIIDLAASSPEVAIDGADVVILAAPPLDTPRPAPRPRRAAATGSSAPTP